MTDCSPTCRFGDPYTGLWFLALLGFLLVLLAGPAQAQSDAQSDRTGAPAMSAPGAEGAAPVTPAERARVETIIRDYLLENPEILLEAMQVLEAREREALAARERETLKSLVPTLTASPLSPIFGPEDGTAVMVEFFDYQCGYCKRILPDIQRIMEEDPELVTIFVEFPILSEESVVAARAALASQRQGRYLDYHAALMGHRGPLSEATIFQLAEGIGLDVGQLQEDMTDPGIDAYLQTVRSLAQGLNIRGTPTMVIGDEIIRGAVPPAQLIEAISSARADAAGSAKVQDGG